jgi:hypothetical protein
MHYSACGAGALRTLYDEQKPSSPLRDSTTGIEWNSNDSEETKARNIANCMAKRLTFGAYLREMLHPIRATSVLFSGDYVKDQRDNMPLAFVYESCQNVLEVPPDEIQFLKDFAESRAQGIGNFGALCGELVADDDAFIEGSDAHKILSKFTDENVKLMQVYFCLGKDGYDRKIRNLFNTVTALHQG